MTRLLFLGLAQLSHGDLSIAADFARQLPPSRFEVAFVSTASGVRFLRGLGLTAYALEAGSPVLNRSVFHRLVEEFRPDVLVAADAYTLEHSSSWSGLTMRLLRRRYGLPMASFDQYDWTATGHIVDFYPDRRVQFPKLVESCEFVIRNCPLNRPAPSSPGVIVNRMTGDSSGLVPRPERRDRPVVFLSNSRWEYVNVVRTRELQQLIESMPHVIHSHLAALGRPLRIVHVGPKPWDFPLSEHIEYQHTTGLPPARFREQLVGANVYLTANATSVTLTQAVLSGVPALLLQNDRTIPMGPDHDAELSWLHAAAPRLTSVHPFRVFPWGWHEFLTPVLTDNPYTRCFRTAGAFDRTEVLSALTGLLDGTAHHDLHEQQHRFRATLADLPSAVETLSSLVTSR